MDFNRSNFRPSTIPTPPSYSWLGPQQSSSNNESPQATARTPCLTLTQNSHKNRPSHNAISNTNSFSTKCDKNNVFKPLEINNTTADISVDDAKNDQLKLPQEQLTKHSDSKKVIDSIETFVNDDSDIDNLETVASDKHHSAIVNPVISELGQWLA